MTQTFRVYRYHVGCHVWDVKADTPEAAHAKLDEISNGDRPIDDADCTFLHEANEPCENHFFTEVFRYVDRAEDETEDDPVFTFNPACAQIWREV